MSELQANDPGQSSKGQTQKEQASSKSDKSLEVKSDEKGQPPIKIGGNIDANTKRKPNFDTDFWNRGGKDLVNSFGVSKGRQINILQNLESNEPKNEKDSGQKNKEDGKEGKSALNWTNLNHSIQDLVEKGQIKIDPVISFEDVLKLKRSSEIKPQDYKKKAENRKDNGNREQKGNSVDSNSKTKILVEPLKNGKESHKEGYKESVLNSNKEPITNKKDKELNFSSSQQPLAKNKNSDMEKKNSNPQINKIGNLQLSKAISNEL